MCIFPLGKRSICLVSDQTFFECSALCADSHLKVDEADGWNLPLHESLHLPHLEREENAMPQTLAP